MKTTNIIAILATIIGLLAFSSQNLSAQTYDANEAIKYINTYVNPDCDKLACVDSWNTTDYKNSNKFNGKDLGPDGTHCISYVSEALVKGGLSQDDEEGTATDRKYDFYSYGTDWWYKDYDKHAVAWTSIRFFLGRIFVNAKVWNINTSESPIWRFGQRVNGDVPWNREEPSYGTLYRGKWSELKPVIRKPKYAKAGDIALLRNRDSMTFQHAVLVTKDAYRKNGKYYFKYSGHTTDKKNFEIEAKDSAWRILHFNANRIDYDKDSDDDSSSTPTPTPTPQTSSVGNSSGHFDITNDLKLGERPVTCYLHGKKNESNKEYYNVFYKKVKNTIARYYRVEKFHSNTSVRIVMVSYPWSDDEPFLFLYNLNSRGRNLVKYSTKRTTSTWNGFKYTYIDYTLKAGVQYYIDATTHYKESGAYMYLYMVSR